MFGFFKSKPITILAVSNGEIISLENVKDEVFSQKLAGDGMAIIPLGKNILSPIDGVISKIFPTNHAFIISAKNNLEIMVHIGLDTVELKGNGFKRLLEEGKKVKAGDAIIEVDFKYLKSQKKDIVTPILVNSEKNITIKNRKIGLIKEKEAIFEVIFN